MSNTLADLTVKQLQKVLSLREKIDALAAQLNELMGGEMPVPFFKEPKKGRRKMSASARAKIGAAQKARWAKQKREPVEKPVKKGRRKMSPAARAKIAAAAKARWAKVKAAGKSRL